MTGDAPTQPERVALTTADGLRLRAEWSTASTDVVPSAPALPTAVLCHPHPLHGGNMHASVIDRLFRQLPHIGVSALRFNFRGVQGSDGRHDHGDRERLDVMAATDFAVASRPDAPVRLMGWSFGADLALATEHEAIDGWIAIAPPLRVHDPSDNPAATDPRRAHLIVGEHDAFRPPADVRQLTSSWVNTVVTSIPEADHFFTATLGHLVSIVLAEFGTA